MTPISPRIVSGPLQQAPGIKGGSAGAQFAPVPPGETITSPNVSRRIREFFGLRGSYAPTLREDIAPVYLTNERGDEAQFPTYLASGLAMQQLTHESRWWKIQNPAESGVIVRLHEIRLMVSASSDTILEPYAGRPILPIYTYNFGTGIEPIQNHWNIQAIRESNPPVARVGEQSPGGASISVNEYGLYSMRNVAPADVFGSLEHIHDIQPGSEIASTLKNITDSIANPSVGWSVNASVFWSEIPLGG